MQFSRAARIRAVFFLHAISSGGLYSRVAEIQQTLHVDAATLGLVFLGFPLHPAGKPSHERAKHLGDVKIPMLFLQGTRDALAELHLLEPVVQGLGPRATLHLVKHADHSFHVLKSSGRNDREVLAEVLDAFAVWVAKT